VRAVIAGLAAASLALVACGGGDDDGTEPPTATTPAAEREALTAAERDLVQRSERTVRAYCARFAAASLGEGRSPSGPKQVRATEALDRLIALAREKPAAEVGAGADLGLFLGDLAEDFEGLNCDPRLLQRVERGLAELPSP
jgi:hypothetical protein